jgi:hypothetical protein
MSEAKEKFTVTSKEYDALMDIRGLAQGAHYLVMCAKLQTNGSWILEGSEEEFNQLSSDLSDEIYHRLSPATRLRHLAKLYDRLNPDCGDF